MEDLVSGILKPGRYINREWNSVHKKWEDGLLKFALCFPDIYEIGMSHLGLRILYGVLNQEKDVICERFFAPWKDMEMKLRSERRVLRSLEDQKELRDFDVIGFSLQYEMSFVDVLNILELGKVLLWTKERGDTDPIVIAGGPCAFNPEPMADFIDAFVIGEAEEAVIEIVNIIRELKIESRTQRSRILKELSKIKGVYVPLSPLSRGRLNVSSPMGRGKGEGGIQKRIIKDIDNSYFPTKLVVPYIQIVHDRVSIEIMRGCRYSCRFCQARKIFYPLRIRSVKRILEIAEDAIEMTGYEEISLLSLSTGDYPYMEELVRKLDERFKNRGIKISLPSMRVRNLDDTYAGHIVKRRGLTFAPEAGSERLRGHLNKRIENRDIIEHANIALKSGWKKIKLYFMIGLPGEKYEDLDAIIELASQIKSVHLSISPFIPKPHSEFEREGQDDLGGLKEKQEYLKAKSREKRWGKNFKMNFHDLEMSKVEAVLSRGDRALGQVIYKVWQKGSRLQAWRKNFSYDLWKECFEECGAYPESYLKKREKGESLPWRFIIA